MRLREIKFPVISLESNSDDGKIMSRYIWKCCHQNLWLTSLLCRARERDFQLSRSAAFCEGGRVWASVLCRYSKNHLITLNFLIYVVWRQIFSVFMTMLMYCFVYRSYEFVFLSVLIRVQIWAYTKPHYTGSYASLDSMPMHSHVRS